MFKDPKDDPRDRYYNRWVELKPSEIHGWGVFATQDIPKGRVIEVAPAIVYSETLHREARDMVSFPGARSHHVHVLETYCFQWDACGMVAIGMGWLGIYNHSFQPNITVNSQREPDLPGLVVMTTQDVKKGEELCHMYSRFEDGVPFVVAEGTQRVGGTLEGTLSAFKEKDLPTAGLRYHAKSIIKKEEIDKEMASRESLGSVFNLSWGKDKE